jgi:hypothetical protein
MIRSEVMAWAAILLVIVFAFVLIPVHERFVDAQGRYTDVSPNAPPRPSWMSGPTTGSLVSASDVRPVDSSTAYSRTAPPIRPLGAPTSNMSTSTTTYQQFMDAKKKFYNTLALNETDYQLKFFFGEETFEFPPSMASNPISASQVSEYKLYTSSYTSVQAIASAVNQPKPTSGRGGVDVFLRSAAGILFPATGSGVLGAPTSNMASAPVGVGVGTVATTSACWELADTTAGKFIDWRVYLDFMTTINPKLEACTRGSPPPPTGPTAAQKACFANAGMYFSLEEAQTACASDSACKAVVGGAPGPVTNYTKFNGDAKIVTLDLTPGAVPPGLIGTKAYVKKPCGGSTNLSLLPSPTAPAPRISSTLGVGDPSLSGMNASYTSGIRPPSGSPWEGLQGLTEMASVPTDPFFNAQTRPTPPLGNLRPTEPDMGLFGPGPNVLRKNLMSCTCASQAAGCSVHPRR